MNISMLHRRNLFALAAASALPWPARSQSFPSRPLKLVVPNAAGGAADLTARIVAPKAAPRRNCASTWQRTSNAGAT